MVNTDNFDEITLTMVRLLQLWATRCTSTKQAGPQLFSGGAKKIEYVLHCNALKREKC